MDDNLVWSSYNAKHVCLVTAQKWNLFPWTFWLQIQGLKSWDKNFMAHTWKVFRYHILGTLSDRYENVTSDWLWIEVCQTAVLNKIDITMATMNKQTEIVKSRTLRHLDLQLNIRHQKVQLVFSKNHHEK